MKADATMHTEHTVDLLGPLRVDSLPPYPLGSIAHAVLEARSAGRDVIDLSQIHPALPPNPRALEKLVQASLLPHNHRYSASQGITRLREAIADYYGRRFGVEIDPAREVACTFGIKEGLAHFLSSVCFPGDGVLIPTPCYPVHSAGVTIAGASWRSVPLFSSADEAFDTKFSLTGENDAFFSRLEAAVAASWPRPRLLLLSFPHNPTGATAELSFFERLVDLAKAHSLFLVHDFAYGDISFDGYRPVSILAARGAKERAVEFYSMSKGFNLPGWRVGFCLGRAELVSALKRTKSYLDFGIFQPLQIAVADVLEHNSEFVAEISAEYESRRDLVAGELKRFGWRLELPKATPFLWAQPPADQISDGSLAFSHRLLTGKDVAVCPGAGFDSDTDSFVRLALIEPQHRLRRALDRLARVAKQQAPHQSSGARA